MDNALFAVNYLTFFTGAGLAYMVSGFTFQAEVTVLQLFRTRGQLIEADARRTNLTSGLHVGYQIVPGIFASGELHLQSWLSTPSFLEMAPSAREQASFTVGVRAQIRASSRIVIRPGASFSMALDDPMAGDGWKIIQLDVPVIF
jgi:hypothetical protein